MQVADLMTENPRACHTGDSATDALEHMDACGCGAVPIVDKNDRLIGIATDRDVAFGLKEHGGRLDKLSIDECMTKDPFTLRPDMTAEEAVRTMGDKRIRRAPVIDADGRLVGIVAQADIATQVGDEPLVARYLREVSSAPAMEPAPQR